MDEAQFLAALGRVTEFLADVAPVIYAALIISVLTRGIGDRVRYREYVKERSERDKRGIELETIAKDSTAEVEASLGIEVGRRGHVWSRFFEYLSNQSAKEREPRAK